MRMMKLFAVAFQTGSKDEVVKYITGFEGYLNDVNGSVSALLAISKELDAALDVAGHVLPISTLASGSASAATVDVPASTTLPEAPAVPEPAPVQVETPPAPAAPEPAAVPLPTASQPEPAPAPTPEAVVALPTSSVALPEVAQPEVEETTINVESEKQVAKATQDAFSGAFSSELIPEPEPTVDPEPVAIEEDTGTEFVSAAEHFIAADGDGSGALDVEELAQATGTDLEEAAALHAEADTDGDGVVTLSEFIASPAAEKTAALPKPIAPVRRPLGQRTAPAQPQPAPTQQPPQPQPWQQPQQQGWPAQQPQQQQGWPAQQPQQQGWPRPQAPLVQPTIRSGVHCRGCGIGLDPYWRFCPVCGMQNLGY